MGEVGSSGGVTLAYAAATDVGLTRAVNEDALLMDPPVFLVADGMGGHHAGDVASQIVVEEFARVASAESLALDEVLAAIRRANAAVVDQGTDDAALSGMGTTAVGLVLVENGPTTSWLLFNVGDSRAYRLADGNLDLLSVDHSYVQELVTAGEISEEEARAHPNRNVVTRALGVGDGPHPDLWFHEPRVGERYLLCSDGLTTEVDDSGIRDALLAHTDPSAAARELVQQALGAGGHDNVSVVIVDVVAVDRDAAAAGETTSPRGVPIVRDQVPTPLSVDPSPAVPLDVDGVGRTLVTPGLIDVPTVDPVIDDLQSDDGEMLIVGVPDFGSSPSVQPDGKSMTEGDPGADRGVGVAHEEDVDD